MIVNTKIIFFFFLYFSLTAFLSSFLQFSNALSFLSSILFIILPDKYIDKIDSIKKAISLLLINILVFWEREKIIEKGIQNSELNLQIQKEKDIADYYRLMLKRDEELKIIIHDYKKHLQAIEILCKTERTQESSWVS